MPTTTGEVVLRIPLDLPAGLNSDDTAFASSPAWADGSNVRFRFGKAQVIGGWESITTSLLTGVCRTVLAWTDNANGLNLGFGTHSKLQLWTGGGLYDITPFGPPTLLPTATPFSVTNTSTTVTVTHTAHGRTTSDSVIIAGAVDTGGITAANLNGTRTITVTTANAYTFVAGAAATSTATGGGSAVVVTPQVLLPAGSIDGSGSAGYGTGTYGGGLYGAPSTDDYFPRTWSLTAWGQTLIANPRGGGIYQWSNVTATKAVAVVNAPTQVNYVLASPQFQLFALGCTQENGVFNPKTIRHSATRDETTWASAVTTASTAREYALPGGGRLVAGRVCGKNLLIWSNHELWLGTYVGQVNQVWRFDKVGDKCGLIGPNAAVVLGSTAYWISPDRQFHAYSLGGAVQTIPCPIREDFADNLAATQGDKIVASSNAEYSEIRFDYPDSREGYENSRYLAVSIEGPDAGCWYKGIMARTAFVDAGPSAYPVGVTYAGAIYWHEKGSLGDGGAFSWHIETADIFLDENLTVLARQAWPDIAGQVGPVSLTITTRLYPQGEATTYGPYAMTPSQDFVNFKASGRLFRVKFSGNAAPTAARLGRIEFDVKARGRK